jgi:transcriptional regulator with XRE-family HTH domain
VFFVFDLYNGGHTRAYSYCPTLSRQRILKMNERIKEVRKSLGLTQDAFGERLGVLGASISSLEKGKSSVTEQTVKLIVSEFGVNETWLRTGAGEMFGDKARAEQLNAALNREGNEFVRDVIYKMAELSPDQAAAFRDFVFGVVAAHEAAVESEPKAPIEFPTEGDQSVRVEKDA